MSSTRPPAGERYFAELDALDGSAGAGGLAGTLDDVAGFVRRYVVVTGAQADAVAVWVAHTHALDAADATPYLHVTSAEKESGKTRLLEVLELLAARPLRAGGTTAAALARAVAQQPPPTMLLDETDNTFKRDREYIAALMGLLNDGYRRGGRTLLCLPPRWEPSLLPVFSPKAIAGIGDLPDTVASRSVRVELKRRAPGEPVERFRRRDADERAEPTRITLEALAEQLTPKLADARPSLPDELGDRAQDTWEPLLAIADAAGGDWPARARAAAVELSGSRPAEDDSLGVRLLADIRNITYAQGVDRVATAELLNRLRADDEAPWGDLHGRPLTARTLARLLKPYGVQSRTVRFEDAKTAKGYLVEQFTAPFTRYLPSDPSHRHNPHQQTENGNFRSVTPSRPVTDGESRKPAPANGCDGVTDKPGVPGSRPLIGDERYPVWLAEQGNAGYLTPDEFSEQYRLHRLVERAGGAA